MKKNIFTAVALFFVATVALAQGLGGEAVFSYEDYDFGTTSEAGFRQSYTLRLDKNLSPATKFRLFFRGDDFDSARSGDAPSARLDSRQLQPGAELMVNLGNVRVQGRTELFLAENSDSGSNNSLGRTSAGIVWTPERMPEFRILAVRNETQNDDAVTDLRDQSVFGSTSWARGDLLLTASERYSDYVDRTTGFQRVSTAHGFDGAYGKVFLDGRFSLAVQGNAQVIDSTERALDADSPVSVPDPVFVSQVLYAIDETPLNSSEVQLTPVGGLTDGLVSAITVVSIGPEASSFQNLVLDLGRTARADEIRIFALDASGNPLRTGGGPVTWDVYVSQDSLVWTAVSSEGSFDRGQSFYRVTFDTIQTRWIKVVNFGVNTEAAFLTEIDLFVHATLGPGGRREHSNEFYSSSVSLTAKPAKRLDLSYIGGFTAGEQSGDVLSTVSSSGIDHDFGARFALTRSTSVRGQHTRRDTEYADQQDFMRRTAAYFDWNPTTRLSTIVELATQDQSYEGESYEITTEAVHIRAIVLESLSLTLTSGFQSQTLDGEELGNRTFAVLGAQAQLTRALRLLLSGTIQQVDSSQNDPGTVLLGTERDNRVAAELVWRPGRPLMLGVRVGWNEGLTESGLTQKYRVEWYPFADGAVSIGGTYDEDIDPLFDRRSKRILFNPRWVINPAASLDFNFSRVSYESQLFRQEQQAVFAMLTLRR